MNTKEMFIDSVKYSLKVKWDFLFLRFVFWLLTFNLYIINENFFFCLLFIIPWSLLDSIEGRYIATIIEETIFGSDVNPKFKNLKKLIVRGNKRSFYLYYLWFYTISYIDNFNIWFDYVFI